MENKTKCPYCNSVKGFEQSVEDVKLLDGKIDKTTFVRCVACKAAITAFDRTTLLVCANQILNKIP